MKHQYQAYAVPISVKGIVVENGEVWLRKNERDEWELPGGKLDKGEQPEETIVREMREELGFAVTVKELVSAHIYSISRSVDESQGVLILSYTCEILSRSGNYEINGEGGKAEFQRFPLSEIQKLPMPDFYKVMISQMQRSNN